MFSVVADAAPANAIGKLVALTNGRISLEAIDPGTNAPPTSLQTISSTTTTTTNAATTIAAASADEDGFVVLESDENAQCTLTLKCSWQATHALLALVFDVPPSQVQPGDWIGLFDAGVFVCLFLLRIAISNFLFILISLFVFCNKNNNRR